MQTDASTPQPQASHRQQDPWAPDHVVNCLHRRPGAHMSQRPGVRYTRQELLHSFRPLSPGLRGVKNTDQPPTQPFPAAGPTQDLLCAGDMGYVERAATMSAKLALLVEHQEMAKTHLAKAEALTANLATDMHAHLKQGQHIMARYRPSRPVHDV